MQRRKSRKNSKDRSKGGRGRGDQYIHGQAKTNSTVEWSSCYIQLGKHLYIAYSFNNESPRTPFLNRSSAVFQLMTFQIPSTYEALLLRYCMDH